MQSVLAKWYCGDPCILLEMELREVEKKVGETSVSLVLKKEEVGLRSPLPSGSWQRQQGNGGLAIGFITCSLDVKQAFDKVSPENLSLVMTEMGIDPILARAILREQISGNYDICFQETRITGIPFDKSIKQGGKEISCLFNLMMTSVFRTTQEEWKNLRIGTKIRGSRTDQEEGRVRHMIFADNCYLFAETEDQISKMLGDAAGNLKKRGLDWKEDQMELISWSLDEKVGDFKIEEGGKEYVIKEVNSLKTMGALYHEGS